MVLNERRTYYYRGLWDEAVLAAESALPVAWEIGEWAVIMFSSAWLAMAYSKLGQLDNARRILDRLFNEMPARIVKSHWMAIPYVQIARAEIQLITGDHNEALNTVREALAAAERGVHFVSKKSRPTEFSGKSTKRWGIGPRPTPPSAAALRSSTSPMSSRTRSNAVGLWTLPSRRQYAGGPGVD